MTGTHGGRRLGAGRKFGSATVLTRRKANQLASADITPLDVMQRNMVFWQRKAERLEEQLNLYEPLQNDPEISSKISNLSRLLTEAVQNSQSCAVDLAPFCHPRLAAIQYSETPSRTINFIVTPEMERL